MTLRALIVDPDDHVATALADLDAGESLRLAAGSQTHEVTVREPIPYGHKLALMNLSAGQAVLKYGAPIGRARFDIAAGSHVHLHNLSTQRVGGLA